MIFSGVLFSDFARAGGAAGEYLSLPDFLERAFPDQEPSAGTLWLDETLKQQIREDYGQAYPRLRIRYWQSDKRTAWVLDEIGKEQPITVGVVVEDRKIIQLSILTFRESRGWEVRHPFFTRQFDRLGLDGSQRLSGHIDSITGATLSVRAVSKVARLALLFDQSLTSEELTSEELAVESTALEGSAP
ncbi:FMN-binding protein [Spongiibacter sp. KMU-158]|uniref:FMN-binding protein n=1 Tax=Spongiibacter pelagi TaxID=2760804 RepID=A0A927C2H0_9GAMM|nr:FMN-binding protein [Spongiibacter pelagi]